MKAPFKIEVKLYDGSGAEKACTSLSGLSQADVVEAQTKIAGFCVAAAAAKLAEKA